MAFCVCRSRTSVTCSGIFVPEQKQLLDPEFDCKIRTSSAGRVVSCILCRRSCQSCDQPPPRCGVRVGKRRVLCLRVDRKQKYLQTLLASPAQCDCIGESRLWDLWRECENRWLRSRMACTSQEAFWAPASSALCLPSRRSPAEVTETERNRDRDRQETETETALVTGAERDSNRGIPT
eukprot:748346-Rhodomonas_salina.2